MPRPLKIVLIVVAVLLIAGAAAVAIAWQRLPQLVADGASAMTGRTVRIGALTATPGRWIRLEFRDASLANAPGGSRPEMATVKHAVAELSVWPLLHGTILLRGVEVDGADLLLEMIGGQPNWRNGPRRPAPKGRERKGAPTVLGATVSGTVTFRTNSGNALVTTLDGMRLAAADPAAPATLSGPGSYQGAAIQLDAKLGSFDQLHDAATPFPTVITMTTGDTALHFDGTMTDPLNVDGADGKLELRAPTPAALEKIAGIDPSPAPPLYLAGHLVRDDDHWTLSDSTGALGDAPLAGGTASLDEGDPDKHTPDRIALDLRFGDVDMDRLLDAFSGGSGDAANGETGFIPPAEPDPVVDAKLRAASLVYQNIKLSEPSLSITEGPGLLKLDGLSAGALGGRVRLGGELRAGSDGKTAALTATLGAEALAVAELRRALGIGQIPLAGHVDIHAVADGTAAGAAAALRASRAYVVATMSGGNVSKQLVELASTDIAGLFHSSRDMTRLGCLLMVMDVRNGAATIGPVRLRSADGTIMARGRADLRRQTLDVVVASQARTTGFLALDVPIRVSGRFDDPSVDVAGSDAGDAARADSLAGLPAGLRPYAERSACAR